jgi:predicted membrane protein
MGIMAFFITAMLKAVFIDMGMAVGLVAIFAIIRLRSSNFTAKDIAYTYTIFGISVINSLKLLLFPLLGLLIINAIIILMVYLLEEYTAKYIFEKQTVIYDKLDLLKPEKKEKLLKDVSDRKRCSESENPQNKF